MTRRMCQADGFWRLEAYSDNLWLYLGVSNTDDSSTDLCLSVPELVELFSVGILLMSHLIVTYINSSCDLVPQQCFNIPFTVYRLPSLQPR